ncbi:MAG TPA: hypothetical protein EYH08_02220 [Pyrodictium sp.]|nr:hypothetical protein [Pyrodictium sp.]
MATTHTVEGTWVSHPSPTLDAQVDAELEMVVEELVYAASIYGLLDALGIDSVEARALFEEKAAMFLKAVNYKYSEKIFKYLYRQKRWLPTIVNEFGEEIAKTIVYSIIAAAKGETCTNVVEYSLDTSLALLVEEEPNDLSCTEKAYLAALLLTTPPPEVTAS